MYNQVVIQTFLGGSLLDDKIYHSLLFQQTNPILELLELGNLEFRLLLSIDIDRLFSCRHDEQIAVFMQDSISLVQATTYR